jgi:hypothetical protein
MVERQLLAQEKGSEKTNIRDRDGVGITSDGQTIKRNKIEGSHEN